MKEMVGTLYTMAPEVLTGKTYDRSCDMWSIGVMAFLLLSDDMPFDFSSKKRLIKSVELGRYEFSGRRWDYISCDARRVLSRAATVVDLCRCGCGCHGHFLGGTAQTREYSRNLVLP